MKKILGKFNETGTLLVEAMAMLGLIAMVTPVLYKKAAERTVELQDVNASSQLRALSSAVDSYIKDNFAKITQGETIDGVDYGSFAGATSGTVGPIALSQFADYLPYGFLNDNGTARETKLFTDGYQVWIKLEADYVGADANRRARSQILTGFISAVPKNPQEIGQVRASRIASMVGSNGGYVTGGNAMGAQGIWSVPTNQFPNGNLADNTFVISSLQPISSQGLANEDVLHRKDEPDNDQELNTMETDLFMGSSIGTTRNIRMVNQMIMSPDVNRMVGSNNEPSHNANEMANPLTGNNMNDLTKTLYISRGGGAYIEGTLNAMNSLFSVDNTGINLYGSGEAQDGTNADGTPNMVNRRNAEPTFKVNETSMVYGNPGAGNAKLTVNSRGGTDDKGSMSFGASAMPADATAGTAAVAASESLFADKENFKAGDGTLTVNKNANGWATVIGKDAAGAATAHEGGRTTYTWNNDGVPTEGAEKTGRYEVSINGSAFVKDTMLTGKLKSYNVDAATLRAGVDPANFNGAVDDIDFYTVTKKDSMVAGKGKVLFSVADNHVASDDAGRVSSPAGVSIRTDSIGSRAPGFDVILGNTSVRDRLNDNVVEHYEDDYTTDSGTVRIGAEKGIYLSTYNAAGNIQNSTDTNPVRISLNGDTFTVSKRRPHNSTLGNTFYNTVDSVVDSFNILSTQINTTNEITAADNYWRKWWSRNLHGRMYVGDTAFIVGAKNGNPVFEVFPVAGGGSGVSTGKSWYPDYGASIKMSGGLAVYDYDYNHLQNSDNISDQNGHGRDAAIYANKGRFEIRSTVNDASLDLTKNGKELDKILVVDSNKNTTYVPDNNVAHGSVYIRKGSINLASNRDERLTNENILEQYKKTGENDAITEKRMKGYIAADRFISHYNLPEGSNALKATKKYEYYLTGNNTIEGQQTYAAYNTYEVNPAYTSVMHDIKLTTRGGARLSDILPDFINKGIYVVDNTFDPKVDWAPDVGNKVIPKNEVTNSASNEVSAYAGFIPTPKCPPGYAKVATLTPSGWAMAQAGTPVDKNGIVDIMTHNNPKEYLKVIKAIQDGDTTASIDDIQPLTYQKSTWLRAMVMPYCGEFYSDAKRCENSTDFTGWGAVLGFLYPEAYFNEFLNEGVKNNYEIQKDKNNTIMYWNLFPVHYRELEAYATVYCYFDRSDAIYNSELVDKYDQLKAFEEGNINSYIRDNSDYVKRLNDPNLKYFDPW